MAGCVTRLRCGSGASNGLLSIHSALLRRCGLKAQAERRVEALAKPVVWCKDHQLLNLCTIALNAAADTAMLCTMHNIFMRGPLLVR